MNKAILMLQGCTSDAGKSYLTAGLCRLYANRGVKVAPFKAQNMSNNAGVTPAGLEMGRAQLLQARAARITPEARMNPVLLKPEADTRSQVVVLGKARPELRDVPWLERKHYLWQHVQESLHSLKDDYDMLIIEGAGSPAEVNLKHADIVNMRVAKEVDAKVLLISDIDRGGSFAHLLGTWHCFDASEKSLVKGFILNKFRGDPSLLGNAMDWLEQRTTIPTLGIVPMLRLPLPEEDAFSLQPEFKRGDKPLIAILRTPYIANFDEFDALLQEESVQACFTSEVHELRKADAVIIAGSKQVAKDGAFLWRTGLAQEVQHLATLGVPILGICGGFQLLGQAIDDPEQVESAENITPLGLLAVTTVFAPEKITRQSHVTFLPNGERVSGYEIHHGRTRATPEVEPLLSDGLGFRNKNIMGVYLHGLFDNGNFRSWFLQQLGVQGKQQGEWLEQVDKALDSLAEHLEQHLDMSAIDELFRQKRVTAKKAIIHFFTGGARSGKSRHAEALATELAGDAVSVIVTLQASDDEMQRRIAKHQRERNANWQLIEAGLDMVAALEQAAHDTVLLDCLSGFISNLLLHYEDAGEDVVLEKIMEALEAFITVMQASGKRIIIVSNEVGQGVVPAYPLGRWYRDALGLANQRVAQVADEVNLVTVGLLQKLKKSAKKKTP